MSEEYSVTRYYGSTPGADTSAYVLYSTTSQLGQAIQQGDPGIHRLRVDIACTQNGTLNLYKSRNRGTTWRLVETAAATGNANETVKDEYLMEPFYDYKLEWVNGGAAQAFFEADLSIVPDRASSEASADEPVIDDLGTGEEIIDDLGTGEPIVV